MRPAIDVSHLCKEFRRGPPLETWLLGAVTQRARALVGRAPAHASEDGRPRFALEDVSFEVMPGESVAIVGNNGAGKSTLLRILSRILRPSAGRAQIRGRLQALFEAGAGFERDLTGRDNVYLKAAIHNLSERETARRFDRIVAFAGLEQAIDQPVKLYSTGMRNRLGISVGLHLDHEVLLLDEVFAVVDDAFRERAFALIREQTRRQGVSLLLVSHEQPHLQALCERGIALRAGRVICDGTLAASLSALRLNTSERSMRESSCAGGAD
jgi:ABC-type polysaccharide/polyol phosphate transport system ATPase subunit